MPAYRGTSLEELRYQDYQQGRKTAGAFGQSSFGGTTTTRIYSKARLRSLPVHPCSAVAPAREKARSEAREQQAILVLALELSHNQPTQPATGTGTGIFGSASAAAATPTTTATATTFRLRFVRAATTGTSIFGLGGSSTFGQQNKPATSFGSSTFGWRNSVLHEPSDNQPARARLPQAQQGN
ncbi:hypothetical protein BDR03DRAFT_46216 [Suillus americanus]|nr:hypothetical protein BDR03DRAFT_46216 [Suillus americanus]